MEQGFAGLPEHLQPSNLPRVPPPYSILVEMHKAQERMLATFGRPGEGGPHQSYVTGYAAAIADLASILTRLPR